MPTSPRTRATVKIVLLCLFFIVLGVVGFKLRPKADVTTTGNQHLSPLAEAAMSRIPFEPGVALVAFKSPASNGKQRAKSLESTTIPQTQDRIMSVTPVADNLDIYKVRFNLPQKTSTSAQAPSQPNASVAYAADPGSGLASSIQNQILQAQKKTLGFYRPMSLDDRLTMKQTLDAIAQLQKDPRFRYVQPNYIYQAASLPNDTYINPSGDGTTWSTGAFGQSYEDLWGLKQQEVDKAWDKSTGKGVIVAVVDTGVDYKHPDLYNNILTADKDPNRPGNSAPSNHVVGHNFAIELPSDDPNEVMDHFGHGTHVAGIIAAERNNKEGIAGVAPNAFIMPVKVLDDAGYGTDDWIAQGIRFAVDYHARIINLSLGGFGQSAVINDAIGYAHDHNVLVVVAAGNDASDLNNFNPASNANVISVGASTNQGKEAFFSNYGDSLKLSAPGGGDQQVVPNTSWVDLVINNPNVNNILSLKSSAANSMFDPLTVGSHYLRLAGTSMATPFVAGSAALVMAAHPEYSLNQVESVLYKSASDVTDPLDNGGKYPGWDPYSGYGIVNPNKALTTSPSDLPQAVLSGAHREVLSQSQTASPYVVSGTAAGSTFQSYTLSWAWVDLTRLESYPQTWTVLSTGTKPIVKGTLGTLPSSVLKQPQKPILVLRLDVIGKDGLRTTVTKQLVIGFGESAGFPVTLPSQMVEGVPLASATPNTANLVYNDWIGALHAIDASGKALPQWELNDQEKQTLYIDPLITTDQQKHQKVIMTAVDKDPVTGLNYSVFSIHGFQDSEGIHGPSAWSTPVVSGSGSFAYTAAVVKHGNDNLIAVVSASDHKVPDKISFYTDQGKLVSQVPNVSVITTAVGDVIKNGANNEELVFTGFAPVGTSVRQGIFAIDLSQSTPSVKPILVLNPSDSGAYWLGTLQLGDVDGDGAIDFVAGKYGSSADHLLVVTNKPNYPILLDSSYNNDILAGGAPGMILENLADMNRDGVADIGFYDFHTDAITYISLRSKKPVTVSTIKSQDFGWTVAQVDNDPAPEILAYDVPSFAFGLDVRLSIYKSNSAQPTKQFSLAGYPGTSFPMVFNNQGKASSYASVQNPSIEGYLWHKYEFSPSNLKLDWPMFGHDVRQTNNYQTAN